MAKFYLYSARRLPLLINAHRNSLKYFDALRVQFFNLVIYVTPDSFVDFWCENFWYENSLEKFDNSLSKGCSNFSWESASWNRMWIFSKL